MRVFLPAFLREIATSRALQVARPALELCSARLAQRSWNPFQPTKWLPYNQGHADAEPSLGQASAQNHPVRPLRLFLHSSARSSGSLSELEAGHGILPEARSRTPQAREAGRETGREACPAVGAQRRQTRRSPRGRARGSGARASAVCHPLQRHRSAALAKDNESIHMIQETLSSKQRPAITSNRWHVVHARWSGERTNQTKFLR